MLTSDFCSTLHVVHGGAAAGSVNSILRGLSGQCIFEIEDQLSFGPLWGIDNPLGQRSRIDYLSSVFQTVGIDISKLELEKFVGPNSLRFAGQGVSKVVVWYGASVSEQIILRMVCSCFMDVPVMAADVNAGRPNNDTVPAVGACSLQELSDVTAQPLSREDQERLASEFRSLMESKGLVHLFENGLIVGADETHFDTSLIAACPDSFGSAGVVIGELSSHQIGSTFLDYRLRTLAAQGKLEMREDAAQWPGYRVTRVAGLEA